MMTTLIEPPNLNHSGIKGFFTNNTVKGDRDSISRMLDIPEEHIYLPVQKHTSTVHVLLSDMKVVVADAVVTENRGILLGVQVADCVPVLIYDSEKKVAGAVHAGWRGTAHGILKKTLKAMENQFRCMPENIHIAFGPSIQQCCYSVDRDVKDAIPETEDIKDCCRSKNGKYFIDLTSINYHHAIVSGVVDKNIWCSGECTCCNPDRYYSYRYSKGSTGRQGGYIMMR
jgi:YfiH family protein